MILSSLACKQILEPSDTQVLEPAQEDAITHGQLELVVHRNEDQSNEEAK